MNNNVQEVGKVVRERIQVSPGCRLIEEKVTTWAVMVRKEGEEEEEEQHLDLSKIVGK